MKFNRQPFQYDVDSAFFFSGGARGDIVDDIKTALSQGVPLVTLTGTDGSGKTMICRIVERDLGEGHPVLFFEQGVESFDEVIEGISAHVGIDPDEKTADRNLRLNHIVEQLKKEQRRLIVIIDGAESIFLATLERIRRMVDLANNEETTIQLMLSGQPLFLLNFKQLGIVSFQDMEERNYSLDPLDVDTTYQYLNHCIETAAGESHDFFSPRMADRIMDTARGNFRLINRLADRYVTSGSLMDPEEDGFDGSETDEPVISVEDNGRISAPSRLGNVDLDFLKVPRLKYQWYLVAGGVIGLLLVLFLFFGGDESSEPVPETEKVPDLTLNEVEPDPIEIPEIVEQRQPEVVPEQPRPVIEKVVDTVKEAPQENEPSEIVQRQAPEVAPVKENAQPASVSEPETVQTLESAPQKEEIEFETDEAPVTEPVETMVADVEATQEAQTKPVDPTVSEGQDQVSPDEPTVDPVIGGQQTEEQKKVVQEEKTNGEGVAREIVDRREGVAPPLVEKALPEIVETTEDPKTKPTAQSDTAEDVSRGLQEPSAADTIVEREEEDAELVVQVEAAGSKVGEVAEQVEIPTPPSLREDQQKQEKVISTEPIQIPELTVAAKKKQSTESVPFSVVTLKDERKKSPEIKAPAPAPKPILRSQPVATTSEQQTPALPKSVEPKPVASPAVSQIDSVAVRKPAEPLVVPPVKPVVVRKPPETAVPPVQKSGAAVNGQNTRAYYAERLAAGSRWLVGGGNGKYTVQLMVLQSDRAETNLGRILNETDYQSIKNNTYILRKVGQPQTVTLYFGEFNSQEEARQAQKQLPQFLKDLNPYAVAVNEAVNKAKNVQ